MIKTAIVGLALGLSLSFLWVDDTQSSPVREPQVKINANIPEDKCVQTAGLQVRNMLAKNLKYPNTVTNAATQVTPIYRGEQIPFDKIRDGNRLLIEVDYYTDDEGRAAQLTTRAILKGDTCEFVSIVDTNKE